MPKPSEYLKSKGWKPVDAQRIPRDTAWIDPKTNSKMSFVEAVSLQLQRDDQEKG